MLGVSVALRRALVCGHAAAHLDRYAKLSGNVILASGSFQFCQLFHADRRSAPDWKMPLPASSFFWSLQDS